MSLTPQAAYALSKRYTEETIIGEGAIKGKDGISPLAKAERNSEDNGAIITITDKEGTTTAEVKDGKDGAFQPYVLPEATAETLGGIKVGSGLDVEEDGTLNVTVECEVTSVNGEKGDVVLEAADVGTYSKSEIDSKISRAYKAAGAVSFENLPIADEQHLGMVYNITDNFTTNDSFIEGAGFDYPKGTNVVIVVTEANIYKYDVLSGFIDLSDYAEKEETEEKLQFKQDADTAINTSNIVFQRVAEAEKADKDVDGNDIIGTYVKNTEFTDFRSKSHNLFLVKFLSELKRSESGIVYYDLSAFAEKTYFIIYNDTEADISGKICVYYNPSAYSTKSYCELTAPLNQNSYSFCFKVKEYHNSGDIDDSGYNGEIEVLKNYQQNEICLDVAIETLKSQMQGKIDAVPGKGLSSNDLTDERIAQYDAAYNFSLLPHAPSNAERNTIISVKKNGTTLEPDSSRAVNITTTDKKTSTIVIGTSEAGYTANDVDYLCDGTADQAEINAAVASLTNGGKIVLLEGTYNISAPIEMNTTGVKLCGMGHATKIKPSVNNISLIKYNSNWASWSSVSDMWLGCDSKNTTITGIEVIGTWCVKVSDCIIRNVNYGIKSMANNMVFDKIFIEQANYGIVIDTESGYANKIINSCIGFASVVGIRIGASSFANTILNNCFMASSMGIEIAGSKNIVSGSSFTWGAATSVNILSGAVNNIVTENILMGSDVINSGGSTNTILNNKLVS